MSGFSRSPRLIKGAFIIIEGQNEVRQRILFQYNPETLTRSLRARYQYRSDDVYGGEPLGLQGPPAETIRLTIELDAADALEQGAESAVRSGIYPALSALEVLLYPKSDDIVSEDAQLQQGAREIVPPPLPLVLFTWGDRRVVPVRISDLEITEQSFDPDLNPLTASIALSLEVLSYRELGGIQTRGGALSLQRHQAIEQLAEDNAKSGAATGAGAAQQSLPSVLAGSAGLSDLLGGGR